MCLPHIAYCAANLAAVEYENYNSYGSMVIDNMVVHQSVYLSRILPNPPEYYIR